jgi:hypothetical protein
MWKAGSVGCTRPREATHKVGNIGSIEQNIGVASPSRTKLTASRLAIAERERASQERRVFRSDRSRNRLRGARMVLGGQSPVLCARRFNSPPTNAAAGIRASRRAASGNLASGNGGQAVRDRMLLADNGSSRSGRR